MTQETLDRYADNPPDYVVEHCIDRILDEIEIEEEQDAERWDGMA